MDTTADSGAKVAEAREKAEREIRKERYGIMLCGPLFLGPVLLGLARLMFAHWPDFPTAVALEVLAFLLVLPGVAGARKEYEEKLGRRRAAGLEE